MTVLYSCVLQKSGPLKPVLQAPPPAVKPESPPEMEVDDVADKLSQQLFIDDIDIIDRDNPQLCAEYVKEIYVYMMELEVRIKHSSALN